MWRDALGPIAGGAICLFIIVLSSLVLVDDNLKASAETFASVQLGIGVISFALCVLFAVLWWRKKEDAFEYTGPLQPTGPKCFFNLIGFFVGISVVALSSLILQNESEKAVEGTDPTSIYIFAAVTLSAAAIAMIVFGTSVVLWCMRKYQA